MSNQVQVVIRPEHEDLAIPYPDFARPTAGAVAEGFEVHVQPGRLEVLRARELPALLEHIPCSAGIGLESEGRTGKNAHLDPQFDS